VGVGGASVGRFRLQVVQKNITPPNSGVLSYFLIKNYPKQHFSIKTLTKDVVLGCFLGIAEFLQPFCGSSKLEKLKYEPGFWFRLKIGPMN
jgi:hypothetical protein